MELLGVIERCVIRADGCIEWSGAHDGKGYAHFGRDKRTFRVFRTLYELVYGSIPEGRLLHHRCERKWCVNPAHVEPVTMSEHKAFKHPPELKTHCPKGHELSGDNLYVQKVAGTQNKHQRKCRTCERERKSTPEYLAYMRDYYQRRKACGGA